MLLTFYIVQVESLVVFHLREGFRINKFVLGLAPEEAYQLVLRVREATGLPKLIYIGCP